MELKIFWNQKFFVIQNFFQPKIISWIKNLSGQETFLCQTILIKKSFRVKKFWIKKNLGQRIFLTKIVFVKKLFWIKKTLIFN